MSEKDDKKKVSIGDALEAIRSGKSTGAPNKVLSQAPRRRMGRATATFWIRNLQESIERRVDHLYTSIRDDPGARAQMSRRDFYATERFTIPADIVQEVVEMPMGGDAQGPVRIAKFSDLDRSDIRSGQVEKSGEVKSKQAGPGSLSKEDLEKMNLEGKVQGDGGRFDDASGMLDLRNLVFEEVKTAPRQRPKKLKVNPMIKKMFEKRGDSE